MATSRVRIWTYDTDVSLWDYVDLGLCALAVHDSEPCQEETTRRDRTVRIVPPTASEAASWADTVALAFHRKQCYKANTKPAGGTDRTLTEWLKHYVRDKNQEVYVYVDTYGTDEAGTAVNTTTYYKGHLRRPLPPWLVDAQFAIDRGGEYLKLTLVVSLATGEGTVADYTLNPLSGGNLTPRTVS